MITLVNYGLGNIQAFVNIYRALDLPVQVASTPVELAGADRLILPGVGSFDWAMNRLQASGLREPLEELVVGRQRPVLGVCVGMQMLADSSEEGELPGLGWIPGRVLRFRETQEGLRLPHMGWNDVQPTHGDCLFRANETPRFYFLHSYYFEPDSEGDALATTDYGVRFASAVRRNHVFGTQFHPEKSHGWGISLLRNFAEL